MALLADAFPPPIPVLDFLWLGVPEGLVAGVCAVGASIFIVAQLRKRNVRTGFAVLAGAVLFLVADCGAYFAALHHQSERRRERYLERQAAYEASHADAGARGTVDAGSDAGAPRP